MKPADKNNNSGNTPSGEPPIMDNDAAIHDPDNLEPAPKKKKFWKRLWNFVLYFLLVLILIPPSLGILFNDPIVQSLSARLATSVFSKIVGNQTSVDAIKIDLRGRITLHGVLMKDHRDSTMIRVDYLKAVPVFVDWGVVGLVFSRLELDGVEFRYAKYIGDEDANLNVLLNKFSSGDTRPSDPDRKGRAFKLRARKLFLTNSAFRFYDEQRNYDNPGGMDYANFKFDSVNIAITRFKIINDSLNFRIDSMSTVENCGMGISQLSTNFIISNSGLHADGLLLTMDNSQLDLDFGFNYNSFKSYRYFIDSVEMYASIRPSYIMMSDIGYFSDVMRKMPNRVGITGEMTGTVSNLEGRDIRVHYGKKTRVSATGHIVGLPDFYTSNITANVDELSTNTCELKSFGLPIDQRNIDLTEYGDCKDNITASFFFEGYYNDFAAKLNLKTDEGTIDSEIAFTNIIDDTLHFDATIKGDTIQIGKLLEQQPLLGDVNLDIQVKGHGNSFDDLFLEANGKLFSMDFNGYDYSRIRFSGEYDGDTIRGNIRIGDKHLMMDVEGIATLSKTPAIYLDADIVKADLNYLNLWGSQDFSIETKAHVRLNGLDLDNMLASVKLNNSTLNFGEDYYKFQRISLDKSISENGIHNLNFETDIADLSLSGNYEVSTFPGRLIELLNHYFDAIDVKEPDSLLTNQYAYLTLKLKNSDLIDEQFVPGLKISTPTVFDAQIQFDENELRINSQIEKISFQGLDFRNNTLNILPQNDRLALEFFTTNLIIMDSTDTDSTVFGLDDFKFVSVASNDSLNFGFFWDNKIRDLKNYANIEGYYAKRNNISRFKISRFDMSINDTLWGINPDNMVLVDTMGTWFKNMNILGGISEFNLNGKYPRINGDTLFVNFREWNLSNLDIVTQLLNFDIDGIVNGDVELSKMNNNPTFVSDLHIDSLALNKEYLGDAHLVNTWDQVNNSILLKSKVIRSGTSGSGEVFSIDGSYFPFEDEDAIDLNIVFNRFKLTAMESFIADFVTEIEGIANGDLKLTGTIDKPVLIGKVETNRAAMRINYLNTKYSFSNSIYFERDKINFDELVIYDKFGNSANVNGNLSHSYFDKSRFNVSILTDKLLFFNTTSKMNDLYYGSAITSGDIKLSGSPNDIKLKLDVVTQNGTDVSLPLDYSIEISDKDYIIFVEPEIDYSEIEIFELEKEVKTKEEKQAFDIDLKMQLTPRGKVTIYLPSDMGRIESQGRGNLRMKTNSKGDFSLVGDYTVEKGLFHFSLASLVRKRFELVRGGRISWTGDPYDANVNLRGLYRVRTSLSSLGLEIDSTANYKNKVNVECYIILKNQLMNPDIAFEIHFPDLNPDLQRLVYAQLDTTNQALVNEQMISLLVLGSFSYSNASNVNLGSAYFSVLSNQLSNMLSKISDDFDIGVNYRPGDVVSQEEFEVALSTQLFDDRLMVQGQFGMTYDRQTQNASNLVGDVDVGYKITEDGRWILKAFNHSNVNSWYNYSNFEKVSPYTQGVGVAFRKEFTNIADLFKRTRPRKEKKKDKETDPNTDANTDAVSEEETESL